VYKNLKPTKHLNQANKTIIEIIVIVTHD